MYQTNEERAYKPIDFHNIVLDFTDCKYPADIHRVLKDSFGFPEYYGANGDALWDCLNDLFLAQKKLSSKFAEFLPLIKKCKHILSRCLSFLAIYPTIIQILFLNLSHNKKMADTF